MSESIRYVVRSGQAHEYSKMHCLHGRFNLGIKTRTLAFIFGKIRATIDNWIAQWESEKTYCWKSGGVNSRMFNEDKIAFILEIYHKHPTSFLDEVRSKFIKVFRLNLSCSTIWGIVNERGLTRKVIERRAIQINVEDICRFFKEVYIYV